jgi:hypothetical protein
MKAVAVVVSAVVLVSTAPALGQSFTYPDQHRTWSSYSRHGHDVDSQRDRPGDYRCDAYWDRGRDDCDASWRDQRPFHGQERHGHGHRRYTSSPRGGSYVYQPYNQGTQYYGAYGRPDQVYPGAGYGGHPSDAYRARWSEQDQAGRDVNRSAWCAARYRSYDPISGYYRGYSGRLIYCG